MSQSGDHRLKVHSHEKFDGSLWRQYETPDNFILLTGVGRKLMAGHKLAHVLRAYAGDVAEGREGPETSRNLLAYGGNARVYTLGDRQLAIKERIAKEKDGLLPSLERMDRLTDAVEKHCPRWIDIPRHYGILTPKSDTSREFMLMDQIDDGVTLGDILFYGRPDPSQERPPNLTESVAQTYGIVTPELQKDLTERWDILKGEVRGALKAEYMSPDQYLPDIDHNPYNILVEKVDTPVAGSPYKFWIIDQ